MAEASRRSRTCQSVHPPLHISAIGRGPPAQRLRGAEEAPRCPQGACEPRRSGGSERQGLRDAETLRDEEAPRRSSSETLLGLFTLRKKPPHASVAACAHTRYPTAVVFRGTSPWYLPYAGIASKETSAMGSHGESLLCRRVSMSDTNIAVPLPPLGPPQLPRRASPRSDYVHDPNLAVPCPR